ncbi:site-2 protease family protein [Clostridium prolinivorans]|uniref:site-2 protease family protein n=1 Tax=Clostridium prolinivorans TaxID=2769420 RepID=UPI0013E338AC|nr:site-2 protease family protein [Clostridium prolinivorans]
MKKYNNKRFDRIKIIINIAACIILLYGIYACIIKYRKSFDADYLAVICSIILFGILIIGHFSIIIHEIGHAIALKSMGFKIKIFKVGPIKYINNGGKIKIVFDKVGLLLIGGFVTPEVNGVIYDQAGFSKFNRQYIKFIFSGIIVTIAILIIAFILLVFNKAIIVSLLLIIVNWPILIKSLDNENLSYGDFFLIRLLNDKPDYICAILQNNLVLEYPLNSFLVTKIESFLMDSINKKDYDELILGLADKIIDDYIIEEKVLSSELEKLKEWIFENLESTKSDNSISTLTLVKVSHKFLLHEYTLKTKGELTKNYNNLLDFISKNKTINNHEFINRIVNTLKFIYEDRSLLEADFKYIISDLDFLAGECENYKRKVSLIVDKLSKKSVKI